MKRKIILSLLAALLTANVGCVSRAIKEGVGVATGAKGLYVNIPGGTSDTPGSLAGQYQSVKLMPFTNASPTGTPENLNALVDGKLRAMLAETDKDGNKKLPLEFNGPGKTIVVTGTYIYYEKASATGHVFGPFEEVIATVELRDSVTNALLAKGNCVGRTTTSVNIGEDHKAGGLAKGIHKMLKELTAVPEQK